MLRIGFGRAGRGRLAGCARRLDRHRESGGVADEASIAGHDDVPAFYKRPVRKLSNRELAGRANSLAFILQVHWAEHEVRRYEGTRGIGRISLQGRMERASDPEERAALRRELDALEAFKREWEAADVLRVASEFKARFAEEATKLRTELSCRTGIPVGGADDATRAILDEGRVDQATIVALQRALSDMAKRLPG